MNIKELLKDVKNLEELKQAKATYFGKDGIISKMQKELRDLPNDQKAEFGKKINSVKDEAVTEFNKKALEIKQEEINDLIKNEWIDVTDSKSFILPSIHPLTKISNRLKEWFISNGYYQSFVPEIESDVYNFEKLNIPKDHPARDMQDSFYINENMLLRTHNTGATIRMLEEADGKPIATFTIGKVYRNDDDDSTHSHQFMQCDFVNVGNVSFSSLIFTLKSLLSYVFEEEVKIRLRPSYFPFTEPSAEVDIFYKGKWIEVLGSGMLHPNVMKNAKYSKNSIGFAGGIGIERLAMIKYGISDIRDFYLNDKRFLDNFWGVK